MITKINNAINLAKNHTSKLTQDILDMEGMSSAKVRHFLNNIVDVNDNYLEIGVWKGSTLISALFGKPPIQHFAIDNFSNHGDVKDEFIQNCQTHLGFTPNLINADSFSINPLSEGINNITVYFYDGHHSAQSQMKAITHYYPCLANDFVLIVDDYNDRGVQAGTQMGIVECELQVVGEIHLPAYSPICQDKENWWAGLYVAYCRKKT